MHILVISDLPQFVTGGAEMQAARLAEAWMDSGHEVICLGRRMGKGPVRLGRHTTKVHRIWMPMSLGRLGRALTYFLSLAWLLLRYRRWVDVVYIRFLGEGAIIASLLKRLRLLKAVIVSTPANVGGDFGGGDVLFLRTIPGTHHLIRLLDAECDAINLIASDMVPELMRAGFSGKNFSRIPNGIAIHPLPDRKPALGKTFTAVGRLTRQKGYDVLLHALALVRDRLENTRIVIIGDGPERNFLSDLAKDLQVNHFVEWTGELSQPDVRARLEQTDVYLLPSRYEGLSNAGLEAMERGLPLIISRCGGLDCYVNSSIGWVVKREDSTELAAALSDALNATPEQLRNMGACARECAVREFEMESISKRYLTLFEDLLARDAADGALNPD
jgi:glycosyltransferase involved in cell wall biosynthesis